MEVDLREGVAMTTFMDTLVFHTEGLRHEQRPIPEHTDGEVLLRVDFCGICGSDLHAAEPDFRDGTVIGHEISGTILDVGSKVSGFDRGDHVVVNPNGAWCGKCRECRQGAVNLCPDIWNHSVGLAADGGLAPFVALPARMLRKISTEVPLAEAALVEPAAVALRAVHNSGISLAEDAIVFGGGPIGLLVTMMLRASGASQITVVEPSDIRRQKALELGADRVFNPFEDEDLNEFLEDRRPKFGFECSGVAELVNTAVSVLPPRGVLTVTGLSRRSPFFESAELIFKEITLKGNFIYTTEFEEAIRLVESGRIDVSPLITGVYPVARASEALHALREAPDALKILISDHHIDASSTNDGCA